MAKPIEALLDHPLLRRGNHPALNEPAGLTTGFASLDAALPGSGWPACGVTEVLCQRGGIGELSLLMPLLAHLSRQRRWLAWIAPPHIPYAPALSAQGIDLSRVLMVRARPGSERLWAIEQALASGACGAVLAWPERIDPRAMRRLQLAAAEGDTLGFVFRPLDEAREPSPATLRLSLNADLLGLRVEVLKCRGRAGAVLQLDPAHALAEPVFFQSPAGSRPPRHAH